MVTLGLNSSKPVLAIDHDILMTFNKEKKGKVSYSFLFNPPNYFQISNEYNTDGTYTLYNNEESGILQIQSGDIKDHKSNTLLIGAYNEETTQITASVFIEDHRILFLLVLQYS